MTMATVRQRWFHAAAALLLGACSSDGISFIEAPARARCTIDVIGHGEIDLEEDYLPRVVFCENGNADFEALKVQAIAARTYAYYRLRTGDGTIDDGTSDQVYGCDRGDPREEHIRAVRETAGIVLEYMDQVPAGFYVAGALQDGPSCQGGSRDPTNTERFVTYNEGRSGGDVTQTPLGWVNPRNHANRGAMSQNGSDCLAEEGWTYEEILRFYYGADIAIVRAEGIEACTDVLPDAGMAEDAAVAMDAGPPQPMDAGIIDASMPVDASMQPTVALHPGAGEAPGCSAGGHTSVPWIPALMLFALGWRRRR